MKTEIKSGTEAWLEWRRTRITASDWAPLLLDDERRPAWMATPLSIWERITGRAPPESQEGKPWLAWGLYAEAMAAPWYEDLTGRRVVREDVLWTADAGPGAGDLGTAWMGCTLDGTVIDGDSEGVWECKAPGYRGSEAWDSGEGGYVVPIYHQIQVQAQLACVRRGWGAVSCVTWPEHYYGDVQRNDKFIETAWAKLHRFWIEHVLTDEPPAPSASDHDREILTRMHNPRFDEVEMAPEIIDLCRDLELLEADIKPKDLRADKLRNDLRDWMRRHGAKRVVDPGRTIAWQYTTKSLRRVKP